MLNDVWATININRPRRIVVCEAAIRASTTINRKVRFSPLAAAADHGTVTVTQRRDHSLQGLVLTHTPDTCAARASRA